MTWCVDRVILKDTGMSDSTEDFKVQVVKSILADCPKVRHVNIWEDLPENLAAFPQGSPSISQHQLEDNRLAVFALPHL